MQHLAKHYPALTAQVAAVAAWARVNRRCLAGSGQPAGVHVLVKSQLVLFQISHNIHCTCDNTTLSWAVYSGGYWPIG